MASKKLFMVQERENAMKYHKRTNHTTMNTFKEILVGYGWWEKKKKRLRGNKTFTRVSFNKREEEKKTTTNPKTYFPYLKKGEQNKGKWPGSGHFLGFWESTTAVQIQIAYWHYKSLEIKYFQVCIFLWLKPRPSSAIDLHWTCYKFCACAVFHFQSPSTFFLTQIQTK